MQARYENPAVRAWLYPVILPALAWLTGTALASTLATGQGMSGRAVAVVSDHHVRADVLSAHWQLNVWTEAFLSDPPMRPGADTSPILDGRAMALTRLMVTVGEGSASRQLRATIAGLADAHRRRIAVLRAMAVSGADDNARRALDMAVTRHAARLGPADAGARTGLHRQDPRQASL